MHQQAALTQLAKLIANDIAAGHVSEGMNNVGEALASTPETILDLLDLLTKESQKKKPKEPLIQAFAFMISQSLEVLRYGIERNYPKAVAAVEAVRERVRILAQDTSLDPGALLLMLRQFVIAKLDLGDDLQTLMFSQREQEAAPEMLDPVDFHNSLSDMVRQFDGNIFLFQLELAEQISTFPESHRASIVVALLQAPDPLLREAAIGWLLDPGPTTRRDTTLLFQQAANNGQISGTMLRRMITIRNWLPDEERPALDTIIRVCRQKSIECAPQSASMTREIIATGIDGSGVQSMFLMVKDGRKQAAVALLMKQGVGIRDAWVKNGLTKAQAEMFLYHVEREADCYDSSLEHVRLALGHCLAAGREAGTIPPFGLVDVIERIGLTAMHPEAVTVDKLVADLVADIPANRQTAAMIAKQLKGSADWQDDFPFMDSWFEDNEAVDAILPGKNRLLKDQAALVLADHLPSRRAFWAELLGWTALTLRQEEACEDDWMGFALVARELLGDRPLSDISLMTMIAKRTVESWKARL